MEDLCALIRVNKAYQSVVQPLLWTVIEMHLSNFHTNFAHDALRLEEATRRMVPPYNIGLPIKGGFFSDIGARDRSKKFLRTFSSEKTGVKELREERKKELGALVRWLCLPTSTWTSSVLVQAFSYFANLEHLEISGFWSRNSNMDVFEAPLPGLQKLTTLKLRGYFHKEFVRWLLLEPDRIEELQLAILDRPVGSSNCRREDWVNPPPPENQRPDDFYRIREDMSEDELAKVEEHEDLAQEWVAPRALACLTPEIMSRLVSLKRLYLCKPSSGEKVLDDVLYFSTPSDEQIFEEWSALLKATRGTLQHLTLDQRVVAHEDVADGGTNREFMRQCANGPSYERFVKKVLPALLESKRCPNLKVIRLFGFEAHDEGVPKRFCNPMCYPDRSVDVPGQLRAAFPDAEVSDYAGRRLVIENNSGELASCKLVSKFEVHARGMSALRWH
jgi:hypothetical protein